MKRSSGAWVCLLAFLLVTEWAAGNAIDSVEVFDATAEEAFFNGNAQKSVFCYKQALAIYWQYRDSTNLHHLNERIRLIERLAVVARETGECNSIIKHFKTCFHSDSDKRLISKVIYNLLRCEESPVLLEPNLRREILDFYKLQQIDEAAHIQFKDLLNGARFEDKELVNFFFVLEKGFAPAIEAMNQQEAAQSRFNIMSFVSFFTILTSSIFGFIVYILKNKKDHIQKEKIALLKGKERETDRLSADLHDILGYKIVELKDQIKKIDLNTPSKAIATLEQGLDELHQSMRYIVQSNLTPQSLRFGLNSALDTLINRVNQLGTTHFKLYKFGLENRIDSHKEKHVFYIIQELINNIIKHSNCSNASIEITQSKKEITIMADDDGIGYVPSIDTLKTTKSRTEFLRGKIIEDSELNRGTTIIVSIPIC